ncbi:unnamed protein product [Peniophora sp. CBMAI 1063]|nr:unnamed protein product [Peniophora sp. CBMAI 1063]
MPSQSPSKYTVNINYLAGKRLEYEKIALTQQVILDFAHNKGSPNTSSLEMSTALSASDIANPAAFLAECDATLARVYEDGKEPTYSERQSLLDAAERALVVWHEYIMVHASADTQIAVTRRYLELAREWSKTVGSSNDLAGSELRRYPLRRPRVPARPLSHADSCALRNPGALCGKAFLLYPNDTKRSGLWRVTGAQYKETGVRQGRPVHRGWAGEDAEVVYEVMFEECERAFDVESTVVWSLIQDSWYHDESA